MPHVHFTFPDDLKKKLETSVPPRERSQFVARATEEALQMRRLKKVLLSKRFVGSYPQSVKPEAWVRSIRKKSRKIPFPS